MKILDKFLNLENFFGVNSAYSVLWLRILVNCNLYWYFNVGNFCIIP